MMKAAVEDLEEASAGALGTEIIAVTPAYIYRETMGRTPGW